MVVGVSASALLPAVGVQVVFVDEAGVKQSGALEVLWRTGFERVSPVRSFGSFRGQRSFQGSWWFATTGEHVGSESWVERDAVSSAPGTAAGSAQTPTSPTSPPSRRSCAHTGGTGG